MANPFEMSDGALVDEGATSDDRTYAVLMHLSLVAHLILPYIAVIIPVAMWLAKKASSRFIDDHGREQVNFQITLLIYGIALPLAAWVIGVLTCGIGLILVPLAGLAPLALGIVGIIFAVKAANRGAFYRFPMTIRFIPSPP